MLSEYTLSKNIWFILLISNIPYVKFNSILLIFGKFNMKLLIFEVTSYNLHFSIYFLYFEFNITSNFAHIVSIEMSYKTSHSLFELICSKLFATMVLSGILQLVLYQEQILYLLLLPMFLLPQPHLIQYQNQDQQKE